MMGVVGCAPKAINVKGEDTAHYLLMAISTV